MCGCLFIATPFEAFKLVTILQCVGMWEAKSGRKRESERKKGSKKSFLLYHSLFDNYDFKQLKNICYLIDR